MRYLLIEKQEGEGCDYTIGCGLRVTDLGAHLTPESAIADACLNVEGEPDDEAQDDWRDGERARSSIELVAVSATIDLSIELHKRSGERATADQERAHAATEAAEREQLARLRRKYGQ